MVGGTGVVLLDKRPIGRKTAYALTLTPGRHTIAIKGKRGWLQKAFLADPAQPMTMTVDLARYEVLLQP